MNRLLLLGLASLLACAAPAAAPTKAGVLTGTLHAPGSPKGKLAVAWLTPAEATKWRNGNVDADLFRALIERFRPGPAVDLATTATYEIEAPATAAALVVLDVDTTFWETLLGAGRGYVGLGPPGGGDVELKAAPPPKPRTEEPCAGPRFELLEVAAPSLAGSIGNPTQRRFCAYLPASYASSPERHYPVVFLFGGFMSTEMTRFRGRRNVTHAADEIARKTGREAILIGVDASTKAGSSYLEDSPVTGQWNTWLSSAALGAIDDRLRTLKTRSSRGLIGQSTGGYLAISFGLRHPELFGAIGATSPDALDLDVWTFEAAADASTTSGKRRVKPWIFSWARIEAALGGAGQITSYAADWSPGEWPFDLATGQTTPAYDKWRTHSPSRWLDDPARVTKIRDAYSGKILIAVSTRDEFDLTEPAVAFSQKLTKNGIANELALTPPGHFDGTSVRTESALEFVIPRLDSAAP